MASQQLRGKDYADWVKAQAKRRAEIRREYRRVRSLAIVAEKFGLSRGRVSQIVNQDKKQTGKAARGTGAAGSVGNPGKIGEAE